MAGLRIHLPEDFHFGATVVSHGWYLLAPFRWKRSEQRLERPETVGPGRTVDLAISAGASELRVEIRGRTTAADRALIGQRMRRVFQLDVPLAEFHALCARSSSHQAVAGRGFGRLLCSSTPFEDIVKIITTTNTTWRQTMRMNELLVETYGAISPSGARAFPQAEVLAAIDPAELQERCRLGYRAGSIHRLAEGLVSGAIDLEQVGDQTLGTERLLKSYQQLPGIGPYGAAHLLAMDGRHDYIAVDSEFRRFVRERHFRGRQTSDEQMLAKYRRWGRWRYLAYWAELWGSVESDLEEFEKSGVEG
jgi:3-methyladenine DNA glycosylase/8-oxoguanine DNA glycosylase